MHKAITYQRNPHFVFRKGFRTGYRPAITIKVHLNLAVRKVYFLHSLKSGSRMASDSRRLSILTAQEIDDLYGLPRFTEDDRRLYFDLSPTERELVDSVFTISVAVHLVLQLGYFKAKRQFFIYALDAVTEDLGHILRRYFPTRDMAAIKAHSRSTRLEQQQVILKLFGYRPCDAAAKEERHGRQTGDRRLPWHAVSQAVR